jgi:hypothetical protein
VIDLNNPDLSFILLSSKKIDDLIIRFPWHCEEDIDRKGIKYFM